VRSVPLAAALVAIDFCRLACAQGVGEGGKPVDGTAQPSIAWRTFGGEQFWSDELVFGQWRIQRHAISGHYRLLDPHNIRRAWGSDEQCRAAFAQFKQAGSVSPLHGRAVVTLHGLGRSRDHMAAMASSLAKQGEFTSINVSYASTRRSIDQHAQSLARVIHDLDGIDEINFVCHSLGNLVVRRYLGEATADEPRWKVDTRIKRMVMLGPPNNGAQLAELLADVLRDNDVAWFVAGPSAWQLARHWDDAKQKLAIPEFEFGIIAGGCGDDRGLNPLIAGDDDLIVRVEETKLPGACDFKLVNCRHGHLTGDEAVTKCVLSFLQHGYFTSPDEMQPIARAAEAAAVAQP
jgi:hypothetical protein